jgi:hypothetical protein
LGQNAPFFYKFMDFGGNMSQRTDWLPSSRTGQLAMCHDWMMVAGSKTTEWGIPTTVINDLDNLYQFAKDALEVAQDEITRTPVATAECMRGLRH